MIQIVEVGSVFKLKVNRQLLIESLNIARFLLNYLFILVFYLDNFPSEMDLNLCKLFKSCPFSIGFFTPEYYLKVKLKQQNPP